MAREFAKPFYNSVRWKRCRQSYISHRQSIDGGLCETCHDNLGYIVHHKIWLSPSNIDDDDIALGFNNLKYECLQCHGMEAGDGRRCLFDADGQLIPIT